ncbi:MAG TPA: hypothetical protein DDY78_11430 [Planctomycetales bacterium]|nr:hypothetical protein [Planctomycetales bacterium]
MALAASVLALILVGGGGAAWWQLERTAVARDVEAALAEAALHQKAGRWPEVRAALERAEGRLGSSGPESLRQTLHQAKADADMVAELDEIRLRPSETTLEGGRSAHDQAIGRDMDVRYTGAFRRYGIDVEALEAPEAAARVRRSAIRDELLTAIGNWLRMSNASQTKLLAVTEEADDDPWRRSFREAWRRHDAKRMKALAAEAEALAQPPAMLEWLAAYLADAGLSEEAAVLLRQAQQRYPGDFWISLTLGNVCRRLHPPRPQEAVGYMRAAVAIRPGSAGAHHNLGAVLGDSGAWAAALGEFRRAIELDPQDSRAHDGLGATLWNIGDRSGAIGEFRRAVELDPQDSYAQAHLGGALKEGDDLNGAVSEFRQALMLDPNNTRARDDLVKALAPQGRLEEALGTWGAALEQAPPNHDAWNGYAELCAFLGRDEEYRRTCRALLDRFGVDPADFPHAGPFSRMILADFRRVRLTVGDGLAHGL